MKTRQLFVLLAIASAIIIVGALLKITHVAGGDEVLGIGLLAQFGVISYAIIKSWKKE
ncbi:MAG TPA: hypothetical protein VGB43_07140 [Flavobacterium sp.]|jgi:hypothetical protein